MQATYTLLDRALSTRSAAQWARDLNLDPAAIAQAKRRRKLSPRIAGLMAKALHEDAIRWTAIAAVEQEADEAVRTELANSLKL